MTAEAHIFDPQKWVDPEECGGRCKACGWTTLHHPTAQAARDEFTNVHMTSVQRARTGLGTKTPSMANQRDWYETMAADAGQSQSNRKLWQQLADELSTRLGDRKRTSVQTDLF